MKQFVIPMLPPTTNAGFKYGRGRMYQTDAYKEFKANAGWFVPVGVKPYAKDVPLVVTIAFHYWFNRDIDNLKCLLDSLEGRCYENDTQIVELHVVKLKAKKKNETRTIVKVMPTYEYSQLKGAAL